MFWGDENDVGQMRSNTATLEEELKLKNVEFRLEV
jgi:hypothetical protein